MQTKTQPETSTTNTKILDYPRTTPNTTNTMKPEDEERRKNTIISLLNDGDYDQAAQRLKYLITDLRNVI